MAIMARREMIDWGGGELYGTCVAVVVLRVDTETMVFICAEVKPKGE